MQQKLEKSHIIQDNTGLSENSISREVNNILSFIKSSKLA